MAQPGKAATQRAPERCFTRVTSSKNYFATNYLRHVRRA